ncbi:hyaluronidase-2 [Ambystoma mexicanum]|uniref:hyaluronidase-2 n=1 Tax=Ambystoma mexicanum TaxID=8296 RepID=UPI0037E8CF57
MTGGLLLHTRIVLHRPKGRRMPGGPTLALPWFLLFTLASSQTEDDQPTAQPIFTRRPFIVAWNAPTQDCRPRFKVQMDFSLFDLHASPNEGFVDQNLTIFYRERLGLYPYYTQLEPINGGVPQNSSLLDHLDRLQSGIDQYIRTLDKDGLAVIDWEDWRPIWVRNWQTKDIYRKASRQLVRERHPTWKDEQVEKQAIYEFETAAQNFMVKTLRKAKNYRPRQLWGYYLFPDCYNHDYNNNADSYTGRCPDVEESRNDKLAWLWRESTALYPSIYLDPVLASSENGRKFVRARVNEAMRISKKHHVGYSLPVFVYTRPTYNRGLDLLSETDLISTIGESAALGAAGTIFWGDANYTRSKETCSLIKDYLDRDLGHYIVNVTTAAQLCSTVRCHGNGRCLRQNNQSNAYLHLNSASFRIQRSETTSRLEAVGQLSAADREQLWTLFQCQCYVGWHGKSCTNAVGARGGTTRFGGANVIVLLALTMLLFLC